MKWKAYYGDGSSFEGDPYDAPRLNVQLIVQTDPQVGYKLIAGEDYFVWEPDLGWHPTSGFGLYDHLMRAKHPLVLFGRMLPDDAWSKLRYRVLEEWGDKQGWLPSEHKRW